MDSDLSDIDSEVESEISEVKSLAEDDVAYNDDDEDYVETTVPAPKGTRSSQRSKVKSKSNGSNAIGSSRTRKRDQESDSFVDEEDLIPPKRRHAVPTSLPDDEEEMEEAEEEEEEVEEDEIEGGGNGEDEEMALGIGKENSEELPEVMQEEDGPGLDTMTEDDTTESLKPARSKMLLELLGDGSSRKILTEEEVQLRRAENARKRKNLSEKRSEEEKQETINKLLRRRAGKSRSNLPTEDEENSNDSSTFSKPRRPYSSLGMTRTLRKYDQDLYCVLKSNNV